MDHKERLSLVTSFNVINNIFDNDQKCDCGNTLNFVNLEYGELGESFKCKCGQCYLVANDDEITLLVEYRYEYDKNFIIIKDTYYGDVDHDNKCIIKNSIRRTSEKLFFDFKEIDNKKTLDFRYLNCDTNEVTIDSKDFFDNFSFSEFQNLICNFKELCNSNNIKPNYGEILQELCRIENTMDYGEIFRIVFTEHLVELLIKSGLKYLIDINVVPSIKLIKSSLNIDTNASNIGDMLRLPNKVIKLISDNKYSVYKIVSLQGFFEDRNYSEFREFILENEGEFLFNDLNRIRSLLNYGYSSDKLLKYVTGIAKEEELTNSDVLILLDDAYRMSQELEIDFRPYSKNLKVRHDRIQEEYQIIKKKVDKKRLKEAAESIEIKQFGYKYVAKILSTVEDFVYEKEGQKNCVLSYLSTVKKDELLIIAIRRVEELDKTFVTVELRKNSIVQAKGISNARIDKDVMEYLKNLAFKNGWNISKI